MRIALIWITDVQTGKPDWPLGEVYLTKKSPEAVNLIIQKLIGGEAHYCLFWAACLGVPPLKSLTEIADMPGDIWHAGLCLGMGSFPSIMQFINPTWLLNGNPLVNQVATSWRVSLDACLIRTEFLSYLGGIRTEFESLTAASVEMGHRAIMNGGIVRHVPWLLPDNSSLDPVSIPLIDEFRFVALRFKRVWFYWCMVRYLLQNPCHIGRVMYIWDSLRFSSYSSETSYLRNLTASPYYETISVILPTLGRYPYLVNCLESLSKQTILPQQVICVDQNPEGARQPEIYQSFQDKLSLQVIWQNEKGQCLARNTALRAAVGKWIFFADDDSEYPSDTLEKHLQCVQPLKADASTGLSIPPYPYTVPYEYRHHRIAHDLDTGNALVRREAVLKAGGFDRNYDFGKGADIDLGMRLYLQGKLIWHNPDTVRIHHKAETGGLREYNVWWDTKNIELSKPFPTKTHTYWIMRYLPKKQWFDAILNSVLWGKVPRQGSKLKIIGGLVKELLFSIITLYQVYLSIKEADKLLKAGPNFIKEKH